MTLPLSSRDSQPAPRPPANTAQLPSPLSIAGAVLISVTSLGSMCWSCRAPASAPAAAGDHVATLEWKRQHYLAAGRGGSSSSDEAVSLLKAAAAAASTGGGGSSDEEGQGLLTAAGSRKKGEQGGAAGAGAVPSGVAQLAKLGLVGWLNDSSKSWRLGTEVEALAALPPQSAGAVQAGACSDGGNSPSAGGDDGAAAAQAGGVELQVVSTAAPAAMRTSSEKEAALLAAGK